MSHVPNRLNAAIDWAHLQVHDGKSFVVNSYDTDIDIATPKLYRISVPIGVVAHVEVELTLLAAGIGELFEAPTLTAVGTALSAINRNRESSNAARMVVAEDPTISAAGTLLGFARISGAGNPAQPVGGQAYSRHEFELNGGKHYLFRITTDADNNKSWLAVNWYEE